MSWGCFLSVLMSSESESLSELIVRSMTGGSLLSLLLPDSEEEMYVTMNINLTHDGENLLHEKRSETKGSHQLKQIQVLS